MREEELNKLITLPNVKETPLHEKLRGDKVRCLVCERRCIIRNGERGFCKTKININGKLYTIVYGDLSAIESRPIEIKPFYHFYPGSTAITISTWSCNFACPWCQNWTISKACPDPFSANYVPPEKVVEMAVKYGDEGTCVSFNEPTLLFEYSLDLFRIARRHGLYNTYVSNGYMTEKALELLRTAGLDGLKIDIKGDREAYLKYNNADVEVVWRNARRAKELGIHVELVYLLVTKATDYENMILETIERLLKELGPETPIHFTRYYPAYKYNEPPTKIEKLEWAYRMARKMGVYYPYVGNVPGHPYNHTYCPECGEVLIKRYGIEIVDCRITKDFRCPKCGLDLRPHFTGRIVRKRRSFLLI